MPKKTRKKQTPPVINAYAILSERFREAYASVERIERMMKHLNSYEVRRTRVKKAHIKSHDRSAHWRTAFFKKKSKWSFKGF